MAAPQLDRGGVPGPADRCARGRGRALPARAAAPRRGGGGAGAHPPGFGVPEHVGLVDHRQRPPEEVLRAHLAPPAAGGDPVGRSRLDAGVPEGRRLLAHRQVVHGLHTQHHPPGIRIVTRQRAGRGVAEGAAPRPGRRPVRGPPGLLAVLLGNALSLAERLAEQAPPLVRARAGVELGELLAEVVRQRGAVHQDHAAVHLLAQHAQVPDQDGHDGLAGAHPAPQQAAVLAHARPKRLDLFGPEGEHPRARSAS